MDQFLEFIAGVFECDVSEISMDTAYGEFLKWDSLMQLNLTMEIEEKYGVCIPIDEVPNIKKISDLYRFIQ